MVLTTIAADTVADVIEVPLAFSGTVIAHTVSDMEAEKR